LFKDQTAGRDNVRHRNVEHEITRHEFAGHKNAGHEIAGLDSDGECKAEMVLYYM